MRRVAQVLALVAAVNALGGCVISLFSENEAVGVDDVRVEKLEQRMDNVEKKGHEFGY